MTKIQGQFDVSLSIPITVAPDFSGPDLSLCQFQIDGDRVTMSPLNVTEVTCYPGGDYEAPKLTEIRVWISKEIDLGGVQKESLTPSPDEERMFEGVLVEATRRLITIIKHKTNQWDLDTRHPVRAYNCAYSRGDVRLGTVRPMERGAKRLPEYAAGMVIWHASDFQKDLTRAIWQEVAAEASRPALVFFYDELLNDAKTFRSQMRYDVSAIYAAIASELMLEQACELLLRTRKNLSNKQCEAKLRKLNKHQILDLIRELDASVHVKYDDVRKLFNLRNNIAHGKAQTVTGQEAAEAISTAEQLKQHLGSRLYPSTP